MKKAIITVLVITMVLLLSIAAIGTFFLLEKDLFRERYIFHVVEELDSTPIPDVEVEIFERNYDHYNIGSLPFLNDYEPYTESFHVSVHSDEGGKVEVLLPQMNENEGYYIFRFKKDGYMADSDTSLLYSGKAQYAASSQREENVIRFHSLGDLEGRITDQFGKPMENITISITNERGRIDNICRSGSDGYYKMMNLRSGPNKLYYMGPGVERMKNRTIVIEKFEMNFHNITEPISDREMWQVDIKPEFEYRNSKIFSPDDGELIIAFYIEGNKGQEICQTALWYQDGKFSGKVHGGGSYLKVFYLGSENVDRIIRVNTNDGMPHDQIVVGPEMVDAIEIPLFKIVIDC